MVKRMKQNFLLDAGESLETEELIAYKKEKNVLIKHYKVKEDAKDRRKGDHFILNFDQNVLYKENALLERVFSKTFKTFLRKYHKGGTILVIGLGNSSIIGDSFGSRVLERLIATNQYNDFLTIPKVALFTPETTAKTGISSFKLIEMVVGYLRPDVIVLVDSFITNQEKYLNMSLEINDCGIVFADQLRSNKEITYKTFQIPILSIGYPTLLRKKQAIFCKHTILNDLEIICDLVAHSINQIVLN